jgi:transposase
MKKIIRQCVGIDVSKDTLDVAILFLNEDFEVIVFATSIFVNNNKGIKFLMQWIRKNTRKDLPCQIVMEATGVYHENLAYTLANNAFELAIVLPNKIRNFSRSTNIRTITDKISAKIIAEFGLNKKLDNWVMPDEVFRRFKGLSRERNQLMKEKTTAINRKHAYDYSFITTKETEKRNAEHIRFLQKQINQIEKDIKDLINENPWLKEKVNNICSIKGIGLVTAITVIAETTGFNLIRNSKQLVCYAGYDIVVKDSGTSVKSKPRISHKGNKYIRSALYFPAITAVKHDTSFNNFYNRLNNKSNIKMKAYVAIQRKLLVLIYSLWKKDEKYNPYYSRTEQNNRVTNEYKILEQPLQTALTELAQGCS